MKHTESSVALFLLKRFWALTLPHIRVLPLLCNPTELILLVWIWGLLFVVGPAGGPCGPHICQLTQGLLQPNINSRDKLKRKNVAFLSFRAQCDSSYFKSYHESENRHLVEDNVQLKPAGGSFYLMKLLTKIENDNKNTLRTDEFQFVIFKRCCGPAVICDSTTGNDIIMIVSVEWTSLTCAQNSSEKALSRVDWPDNNHLFFLFIFVKNMFAL